MDLPAVDVLIPARNAAPTIEAAVRSVLAQTAPRLRVIVIDDGSTDDTANRVAALAEADPRVHLLRQAGIGISAAMNAGLAMVTAEFVARLDADDLSAPDRHARQLRHLLAHPATAACSGAHHEIDQAGQPTGHIHRPQAGQGSFDPFHIPAHEAPLTQPFFMARREALLRAGGYRALPVSEDSDLYWRLTAFGRLEMLEDILGCYRMHGGSVSSASIRHGRQMALWSQLAALSAQRRQRDMPDLAFPQDVARVPSEAALKDQVATAVTDFGLTKDESDWLTAATAAKLMELAGYRPYELQDTDVDFLSDVLCKTGQNRRDLSAMRSATAARLLRAARLADALQLGRGHWPEVAARAVLGRLYWTKRRA